MRNRLSALAPHTSLICSFYWVLVFHFFGTFTIGDGANYCLSSSIEDASSGVRLPPCLVLSHAPLFAVGLSSSLSGALFPMSTSRHKMVRNLLDGFPCGLG